MKWRKYSIETTTESADLMSMMLNELGVEGVQIEDNVPLTDADTKGMFIDIMPELPPDDGSSKVSFFLHLLEAGEEIPQAIKKDNAGEDNSYSINDKIWSEDEIEQLLKDVEAGIEEMRCYAELGSCKMEVSETEDTDWRNNWKKFFKPVRAGGFLIKPSWESEDYVADTEEEPAKWCIDIDPGTAFGTGSHETTQLCLKAIEKYLQKEDSVLDIGTGSGILGIAAYKAGAKVICATELDEMCEPSIRDNMALNGLREKDFKLIIGNIIGDEAVIKETEDFCLEAAGTEKYDMVIANILAPVIIMLAGEGQADRFIKKGGCFITSGIIDHMESAVVDAFKANANWEIKEICHQGEWVNVTAVRV